MAPANQIASDRFAPWAAWSTTCHDSVVRYIAKRIERVGDAGTLWCQETDPLPTFLHAQQAVEALNRGNYAGHVHYVTA